MSTDPLPAHESEERSWEEHNLSQLRHFRSLSLHEKMEAVQGMADVLRHFADMRARGLFTSADGTDAKSTPNGHEMPRPHAEE